MNPRVTALLLIILLIIGMGLAQLTGPSMIGVWQHGTETHELRSDGTARFFYRGLPQTYEVKQGVLTITSGGTVEHYKIIHLTHDTLILRAAGEIHLRRSQ